MAKMTWEQFLKGLELALRQDTRYAFGAFGWQLNDAYKKRLLTNPDNKQYAAKINSGNVNTFAFDCVCLPKAILWGWDANNKVNYGGAVYASNGVPDIGSNVFTSQAHMTTYSTNIKDVKVGDVLGMKDHMGIYIGDNKVIECTPNLNGGGVIISTLNQRTWLRCGRSKYIDYSGLDKPSPKPEQKPNPKPDTDWTAEPGYEIVLTTDIWERNKPTLSDGAGKVLRKKGDVIKVDAYKHAEGLLWRRIVGSGKVIPTGEGSNDQQWAKLQKITTPKPDRKTNEEIAAEVILGKWGNGAERKKRLTEAGYNYDDIQAIVNESPKPTPIKKGDKVQVINPIQYTGGRFNVYHKDYDVLEVKGDRSVIGKGKTITAAINVINLRKV